MQSIWGRIAKPSVSAEVADEKYYFTTSAGQIVSAEGSGYVIPDIAEEEMEKSDYVPLQFAQSKIKDITDQSNTLREAYQKHLSDLDGYYGKAMSDVKTHYESVVRDTKAKALRHIEVKKQLHTHAEQKMKDDLRQSEESIEELRDSMASLNREYQEEVRRLKSSRYTYKYTHIHIYTCIYTYIHIYIY
jgi:hypothetical protein